MSTIGFLLLVIVGVTLVNLSVLAVWNLLVIKFFEFLPALGFWQMLGILVIYAIVDIVVRVILAGILKLIYRDKVKVKFF